MNCRAAVSIRGEQCGALVDVLYIEPSGVYQMPSGVVCSDAGHIRPSWVCKSLGGPLKLRCGRRSIYGVYPDSSLRPIRGESASVTKTEKANV